VCILTKWHLKRVSFAGFLKEEYHRVLRFRDSLKITNLACFRFTNLSIIKGKSSEIVILTILNTGNSDNVDHLSTKSSRVGVKVDCHDAFKNERQTEGAENILLSNQ
tara:strand:+ start:181 stop:501 length:321 start_codon:yes stop_codon:yes gene_type:complete